MFFNGIDKAHTSDRFEQYARCKLAFPWDPENMSGANMSPDRS